MLIENFMMCKNANFEINLDSSILENECFCSSGFKILYYNFWFVII